MFVERVPQIVTWKGQNIDTLSKEELIAIITQIGTQFHNFYSSEEIDKRTETDLEEFRLPAGNDTNGA